MNGAADFLATCFIVLIAAVAGLSVLGWLIEHVVAPFIEHVVSPVLAPFVNAGNTLERWVNDTANEVSRYKRFPWLWKAGFVFLLSLGGALLLLGGGALLIYIASR